jgi:hypothetical protein
VSVAREVAVDRLSDEEVRSIGFEPTEDGWRRRTCVYCGAALREPFVRWSGAGGSLDLDADCGPALLREGGATLVGATRGMSR